MESLTQSRKKTVNNKYQCIVCGESNSVQEYVYNYNEKHSEILRCANCSHLFIKPAPLVSLNDRTMDSIDDAEFAGSTFLKKLQQNLIIKKEIKNAWKFLKSDQPTLLDLGCGTGWTTAIWRDHGFKVTGLEPSESRGKIARERHRLEVSNKHIEDFNVSQKYDVVIMRHLLEHIEDPMSVLQRIKSFLNPNGLLIIILPNINSIGRYLFRENWAWILPWHLHFYTPRTLSMLIENNGFQKLKLYQMPSPLWYPMSFRKAFGIKGKGGALHLPQSVFMCSAYFPGPSVQFKRQYHVNCKKLTLS